MGSDDGELEVLLDPSSYTRSIEKDNSARWVHGLTPIEDDNSEERVAVVCPRRCRVSRCVGHWLLVPNVLGTLSLLALTMEMVGKSAVYGVSYPGVQRHPLDFPLSEDELWEFAAREGESLAQYMGRVHRIWWVSIVAALFALTLSLKIGVAARDFLALCGVGVSILSLVGTASQLLLLWTSCDTDSAGHDTGCSVPFVLYWCLTVGRLCGPSFAVWLASPVLDEVRGCRFLWKVALALPLLSYTVVVVFLANCSQHDGVAPSCESGNAVYRWCGAALFTSWVPLLFSCYAQRRFRVVFPFKEHPE